MSTEVASRAPGQLRSLFGAAHPRQALAFSIVVGLLVALMGRPAREVLAAAVAVLVAQLVMGLVNDLCDVRRDQRSQVEGKPVAEGIVPTGNATFAVAVLLLLVLPLSLQNGISAGLFLLATLVVGVVHNRFLHTTALSFVGWAVTFGLLTFFITLGGWGGEADGSQPVTAFVVLSALLGVCVHFLTSLPDLVTDNKSGARNLPLQVALRTGAPRLLVVSLVATALVVAAIVFTALTAGIAL